MKCSSGLVYLRSPASSYTFLQCQTDVWCPYVGPGRVSSTVTYAHMWGSAGAHLRSPVIWIDEVSVFMLECQCQGGTHGTFKSCTGTLPHGLPQPTILPLRVSKTFMCLDVHALAHLHTYVIIMARTHMSLHDLRISSDIQMFVLHCAAFVHQTLPLYN